MTLSCLLLLSLLRSASTYPNFAADCPAGKAAAEGHNPTSTTGTFEQAGYSVTLNGAPLVAGQPAIFDVGVDNLLVLAGTSAFRGFLLRLGTGSSTASTFSSISGGNDTNVQVATVCGYFGGVCHNSNSDKSSIRAKLNMAESSNDMPLDVTVVVLNSGGVCEYYYTAYTISAQAMSTPVAPSVLAPTISPTTPSPTSSAMSIGRSCGLTVVANAIAVATIFGPF